METMAGAGDRHPAIVSISSLVSSPTPRTELARISVPSQKYRVRLSIDLDRKEAVANQPGRAEPNRTHPFRASIIINSVLSPKPRKTCTRMTISEEAREQT